MYQFRFHKLQVVVCCVDAQQHAKKEWRLFRLAAAEVGNGHYVDGQILLQSFEKRANDFNYTITYTVTHIAINQNPREKIQVLKFSQAWQLAVLWKVVGSSSTSIGVANLPAGKFAANGALRSLWIDF